jgi:hypothetical protein
LLRGKIAGLTYFSSTLLSFFGNDVLRASRPPVAKFAGIFPGAIGSLLPGIHIRFVLLVGDGKPTLRWAYRSALSD